MTIPGRGQFHRMPPLEAFGGHGILALHSLPARHFISFIMCNIHHDKCMNKSTVKTTNTSDKKNQKQQWTLENETAVNNNS